MKNIFRIIIVIIPILYGFYFCFIKENKVIEFGENEFIIKGYIDDYPEKRIGSNRYRLQIKSIGDFTVKEKSRLLIVTEAYTKYEYGDYIELKGVIEKPEDFITDSGKTFDYDNYLKLTKIYGIARNPEIKIISKNKGNYIKNILFKIRKSFASKINDFLPYENASLTRGILLGEKSDISNEFRLNMSRSSTSHIIALSGYNMTIVSETIMKSLSGMGLFLKSIFGSIGIILFLILAGGSSSAVRASIMAILLIYTKARGYSYNNLYSLLLATAMLIAISPLSLRYDVGFHLSVLATFGLIVYQTKFAAFFIKNKFGKFFSETLASTLAASVMTLPYIVYSIGIFSVLGIIANILIVPLIPPLMLTGFIVGISPKIIALPVSIITEKISGFMIFIINKIGETSWSAYYIQNFSLVLVILIYVFLFYKGFRLLRKDS